MNNIVTNIVNNEMTKLVIEDVKIEDAKELLDIYAPYIEESAVSFEYEVPSVEEFENRIKDFKSNFPYIKAVKDGKILGYAYASRFHPREAYKRSVETTVYVASDGRRGGVGRALYDELERRLKAMGILNLNACIAMPTEEMVSAGGDEYLTEDSYYFHKKMGFELVGRFHGSGYKFDRWYDMIWMEKLIGEHKNKD